MTLIRLGAHSAAGLLKTTWIRFADSDIVQTQSDSISPLNMTLTRHAEGLDCTVYDTIRAQSATGLIKRQAIH